MADVFISYARPNAATAARLADELRMAGHSVWYDQDLPAHRSYADVIEEQLAAAATVVVLWSTDSVASQWVRSEANRARETGRLVQARLDDCALPMPFDQVQCADLRKWRGGTASPGWQTVAASIADLLGCEPAIGGTVPGSRGAIDRRLLVGGGVAAILAAGLGAVAFRGARDGEDEGSPEAQLLLQKGLDALQQFDALDADQPGSAAQAIALLTQATQANPRSSTGWGALAMANAASWRASAPSARPGLADRTRSAADRAFALDRDELRALAALSMIDPPYRRWFAVEATRRRNLSAQPDFPIHIFLLADLLGAVGRWRDAAATSLKANRSRFLIPGADRKMVVNLWGAGRLQEADEALDQAVARWPDHPQVWRTRVAYLLFGGRPNDALRLLDDIATIPAAVPQPMVAVARATAEALAGRRPPAQAVAANLDYLEKSPQLALFAAQACSACGDPATSLALLDGYYFGGGSFAALAPPGGDSDRQTAPLFLPPMRPLWPTPPFAALLRRVGLEDYWRQSRTVPDFRRRA